MKKKILVVDNDLLITEFVAELLAGEGHRVVTAGDGISAMEILTKFIPDIIFVDLVMPRIDGKQLCKIVREMASMKHCYIVVLSGALVEQEKDFREIGADAYVSKSSFDSMADDILLVLEKSAFCTDAESPPVVLNMSNVSRRQMTKELLAQNRHLEIILESIPEGIMEICSGKIVYVNSAALSLFGWKISDALGAFPADLFNAPCRGRVEKFLNGASEDLSDIGPDMPLALNGKLLVMKKLPLASDSNTTMVLVSDITEQKKTEEKLHQIKKMEAIGTLAGGVAHDLNNILSGLVTYPELLMLDLPEESYLYDALATIRKSSQRAVAMVQDLLTLARRGVVSREVGNLNDIIGEYLSSPEFQKLMSCHPGITFDCSLDKNLMNLVGSPVHLSKTVMNLVANAAESMPNHGTIFISTENRYIDEPIHGHDRIEEGDYVVLRISDSGIGISAEDMERIFEPFYTKKKMGRSGTGLGMAVVWGTVKDHQGIIDVDSVEGRGTTFTLYFPATRQQIASDDPERSIADYMGNNETILIVDDVEEQRKIATGMLKKLGYQVASVASGEEAVSYMRHHAADLLILDMIMDPGMDGLETYERILAVRPGQKAIIASGFSETDRVGNAQRLGAGSYIRKPYLLENIGLAVRQELDKKPFVAHGISDVIFTNQLDVLN
jgi:two-component system, cell cycle sensor histidine kinase and response regulator CckA